MTVYMSSSVGPDRVSGFCFFATIAVLTAALCAGIPSESWGQQVGAAPSNLAVDADGIPRILVDCPTATVANVQVPAYIDRVKIVIRGACRCETSPELAKEQLMRYAKDVMSKGLPVAMISAGEQVNVVDLTGFDQPLSVTMYCYTEEQWVSYLEQYTGMQRTRTEVTSSQ